MTLQYWHEETVHEAPWPCSESVIQFVIECGPNLTIRADPHPYPTLHGVFSGIHWATHLGRKTLLTSLLSAGADPDSRAHVLKGLDGKGQPNYQYAGISAIQLAASAGHAAMVRVLLGFGADVQVQRHWAGGCGSTALGLAVCNGYEDVVAVLLEHKVKVGKNVEKERSYVFRAVEDAACSGKENMVRVFLDKGWDVNQRGSLKQTVLHKLVVRCPPGRLDEKWEGMFRLLLDSGADLSIPDCYGSSPRRLAQVTRKMWVLQFLCEGHPQQRVVSDRLQSRSTAPCTAINFPKERRQSFTVWLVRRWLRQKQEAARTECIRAFRSLKVGSEKQG